MLDPMGGFDRIRDFFISYVETSFRIADQTVAAERRRLLETTNVFSTASFIEPILRYKTYEHRIEELVGLAGGPLCTLSVEGQTAFAELALSGLFEGADAAGAVRRVGAYSPYKHQVQMLARGVRPGKPGIVTSGTGSGKTESFMLPVLAALANEAVSWPKPEAGYLEKRWWLGKGSWSKSRRGEKRPAAVRALVLYPMNALVEDQMVRLRRTLDSDEARRVMDGRFNENRIFFGQYTSSTPVTGYESHPRLAGNEAERKRRLRHQRELREAFRKAEADQLAARKYDEAARKRAEAERDAPPEATRFIFPSLDGGEMLSRWDMQATPPDVLVTNASMLGAMLSREVENSIFETTREWLLENDHAYFYLIFDELHLIRGSSGTEVSYLVKSLLHRLGLNEVHHRHKLRILASSASLPMEGEAGIQSRRYLRDLFAPFGTSATAEDAGSTDEAFWADCVIKGEPDLPERQFNEFDPEPFVELVEAARSGGDDFIAKVVRSDRLEAAIDRIADVFGVRDAGDARIGAIAEVAAAVLTSACREGPGVRATKATVLGGRIFGEQNDLKALRGLLLARALPESGQWSAKAAQGTPSFRVHSFVRNIEGLFGAPVRQGDKIGFLDLSVERGLSHGEPQAGQIRGRRLFELLYCEACGDLLIGGQRGRPVGSSSATELLPSTAELENLPERAAAEYYDKMSFDQFAVFWPSRAIPALDGRSWDGWEAASLDPNSGVVSLGEDVSAERIGGRLYNQSTAAAPKGRRSAQPFCCPNCGTDYSNRPASSRSRSPIRAFRTGVSKASQLIATELFELLHAAGAEPKSIVFSDSRQDAANQSLEIERLHLRDLRREVLVTVARDYLVKAAASRIDPEAAMAEFIKLNGEGRAEEAAAILKRLGAQTHDSQISIENSKIQLERLFSYKEGSEGVGALIEEYVNLGVHPFDEVGRKAFEGRPWYEAFQMKGSAVSYAPWLDDAQQEKLGLAIKQELMELVDDVIFANTFFALEETGLAYPSISRDKGGDVDRLDAWLRVFASATRVRENKYFNSATATEWDNASKIPLTNRVRKFADAVYGSAALPELDDVLKALETEKHVNGVIRVGRIFLKVSQPGDPYWRCGACERIHLHRGVGRCTRCYKGLSEGRDGVVDELWDANFLGRRIVRGQRDGVNRFRLRCEELTGQTDDFSDRLRKFKSIFVDDLGEVAKRAREIDMLSVTTTMEVGIDIGALQTVYQANMPPQRFNYQQRVGRAGRRSQAFSSVVTFCRGRSHDAYYFAHPAAITGDPPPPPFLATGHDPIPERLVAKVWLRAAFKEIRDDVAREGLPYPGDFLVPPDVHGEYLPTDEYFDDPRGAGWRDRLRSALHDTIGERDAYIDAACIDKGQRARLRLKASVDEVIAAIDAQKQFKPTNPQGLAQFLAERGILPMYGMPTRVKPLYLGLRAESDEADTDFAWSTMDRDLDTAVFEFAPGAVLTKDKQRHRVVGFSGTLAPPERRGRDVILESLSGWVDSAHSVALCPSCGSARYSLERPIAAEACEDCGTGIEPAVFNNYVTPAAFRSDFRASETDLETVGRMAVRTVATVLHAGDTCDVGHLRLRRGAGVTIMQLNDGVDDDLGQPLRFTVSEAQDQVVWVPRLPAAKLTSSQAISVEELGKSTGRWIIAADSTQSFGLIAKKETDALYLELREFDARLTLDRVARRGAFSHLPTRAAAISATQILVQKAALDLDVSPDEFEALEPRLRGGKPMLQIADALINGSGLCRRLGEDRSDGTPHIVHLIREILSDTGAWPLSDFMRIDEGGDHAARCQSSCYRCIQRYGNRPYHGLLDWRLGLAYLRALVTSGYSAGLEAGDQDWVETRGWRERALALAQSVAGMRPDSLSAEMHEASGLPALRERRQGGNIFLVLHPLWRHDAVTGGDDKVKFVDTFNLERRPLRAMELAMDDQD